MAATSTMLALGTKAPDFALPDVTTGDTVGSTDFAGDKALLVMFICSHCPYVKHVRAELARSARDYQGSGLASSRSARTTPPTYPEDAPEGPRRARPHGAGYVFPYLFDESQEVAKAYTAACTPDFFLFDRGRALVYRGQFDDEPAGQRQPVTGDDLRAAIDAVLAGRPATRTSGRASAAASSGARATNPRSRSFPPSPG